MISQGNIERTFSKKQIVNRLLYSLLTVVFSVLLFPCNSFATHPKAIYAATPVIQPSTGDTLSIAVTYDLLHIIKDHLGSIRAILTSDGNIRERHDYYPFGLRTDQRRAYPTLSDRYTVKVPRLTQTIGGTTTQTGYRTTAPYTLQYNGKELQLLADTTLIDYGARQYNPTLARWTAQDPMAEKYYGISPYAYCAGNPILLVDPNGTIVWKWDRNSLVAEKEDNLSTFAEKLDISEHEAKVILDRSKIDSSGNIKEGTIVKHENLYIDEPAEGKIIDSSLDAVVHYYYGKGELANIGEKSMNKITNSIEFKEIEAIALKNISTTAEKSINLTGSVFHIGKTSISYSVKKNTNYTRVDYTFFKGDGFWDPNFIAERVPSLYLFLMKNQPLLNLATSIYPVLLNTKVDQKGPNLELGGTVYNYNSKRRTFFYPSQ